MKSIKHTFSTLLAVIFFVTAGFTTVENDKLVTTPWTVDKAHSNITFEVTHFFTPVDGQFHDYNANINFDPNNLEESSVSVEIMVNSIDTDNQKRDGHLQSDDFFNAEKYPKMTFESSSISKTGENEFVANGKLKIKDTTKDIELPFTLLGIQNHPMQENTRLAGIKSNFTIDRTEYGVGVGDWAATTVVGDEVDVTLTMELNSKSSS